ncbi:MAG TPA: helix-turn-helix domain-containing protein [Armatimonadota bacterium]
MRNQDWNKYLDQMEMAVEQTMYEPVETKKPAPPVRPAVPARPTAVPTLQRELVSAVVETPVSMPTAAPAPRKPVKVQPVEKALAKKAARIRNKLPDQLLPSDSAQPEVAQRSYKGFKETREELLERLLDPQISLEDTARILNVCPTTVRRYTNRGLLKHIRTAGNQRRFRLSDVLTFMEAQQQGLFDEEMD